METFLVVNMFDEITNDSTILATLLGIMRREGIEKSEIECKQYLYLAFRGKQEKTSGRQISLMSMTNHAVGIGLYSWWHDNSELSPFGDASVIP